MFKIELPAMNVVFEGNCEESNVRIGIGEMDNADWKMEIKFGDVDQIRSFSEMLIDMVNEIENEGDKE